MNEHLPPRPGVSPAAEPPPESLAPLEIAMNAEHADPSPDSPARILLQEQARLVREQIALARNERFRNRIKAARDAALAALALAVVAGGAWVIWDASRADGVVIEPFAVAPSLAQQGLTGPVVANRLLGRIAAMQAATQSARMSRSTRGGGDELSVEIPQTGVSAGEIVRLLRRRLGHETVVTGELAADASGPTLTVYVDGSPLELPPEAPATADAAASTPQAPLAPTPVDRLLGRAAEAVFARTEPYRHATWQMRGGGGRPEEGDEALRRLSTRGPPEERAWAFSGRAASARAAGRMREALALAQQSARLNPDLPNAYQNMVAARTALGHDELELQASRRAIDAIKRAKDFFSAPGQRAQMEIAASRQRGDYQAMIAAAEEGLALAETEAQADGALGAVAIAQALQHDVSAARATGASMNAPTSPGHRRLKTFAAAEHATLENWSALEAYLRLPPPDPEQARVDAAWAATRHRPNLAYAVARQGRAAEAAALIATTPLDCYLCVRQRGRIAALAGDHRSAERWFAEAVRQGPSLPFAYYEWAEARLARGDLDGALRLLKQARRRGPRWADPLKLEGDVLLRQGKPGAASGKYEAAAQRAPRWGALHLAWGRALAALGRDEQARAKYAQAARMDLSAADRAAVQRLLAGRAA